jgi:N utilization substance protein B
VKGVHNARAAADAEFLELAPEWPTNRLAAVDRAILRLAHFEMTSGRTPPKIAVNEAVELAKHYSTEKSPAFINGLLDKVLKRLEPAAPDEPEPSAN